MKNGKLFIVSGPSGVGKNTILQQIYNDPNLNMVQSISMTTRNKRIGETDKVDYFFVDEQEFLKNIHENNFLEYAKYGNNYYGTPKSFVQEQLKSGKNVLLEIDTLGAKKIMDMHIDCYKIFILPPDVETLRIRLQNRGTETPEVIEQRVKKAEIELLSQDMYDAKIINNDLDTAIKEMKQLISNYIQKES